MNLSVNNFTKTHHDFEHFLKSNLNDQNPIAFESSFSIKKKSINNLEILVNEIFCRSVLLIVRSIKCCYAATLCVLSPFSVLKARERLTTPQLAWKSFCKEIRHLGAESFEIIGVVACSVLLLPFDRQNPHSLINAQIWVENIAELISGERIDISYTRVTIDSAKVKKDLLQQAMIIIKISQEEIGKWVEIAVDFDSIMSRINTLQNRRIARDYEPAYLLKEELNKKLSSLEAIISDKITLIAIPQQQQALIGLKRLYNPEYELQLTSHSIDPQLSLSVFEQLSSEIKKTIDQLHVIHDPQNVVKSKLDSLKKDFREVFSQVFDDFKRGVRRFPGGGILGWHQLYQQHFYHANKLLREIEYIYSYENITNSDKNFSENFVSDLIDQIIQCKKLLEVARLTWIAEKMISLNHKEALKILGLTETANHTDIRKSYLRLSLIHHPDKGGQAHVFNIIKKAYDFLIKN